MWLLLASEAGLADLVAARRARIRDSAASSNPLSPKEAGALPSPETLFEAAEDAMPKDLTAATDFDYLRTTALLAITSIQFANPRKMYQHLGTFWTLSTMNRMHDEKRWPQVSRIEAEERRRVYWSMYTLDLFTSISFGSVLRTREATSLVAFPSEIDDEHLLSPDPVQPASTLPWLIGWNFTSRLYRKPHLRLTRSRNLLLTSANHDRNARACSRLGSRARRRRQQPSPRRRRVP